MWEDWRGGFPEKGMIGRRGMNSSTRALGKLTKEIQPFGEKKKQREEDRGRKGVRKESRKKGWALIYLGWGGEKKNRRGRVVNAKDGWNKSWGDVKG